MSKPVSKFKLGLFVLVCGGIGLGALIWIGVAQFFGHTRTYAAFFNISVEGLQNGAPVSYLGVNVGRVSAITLTPDHHLVQVLLAVRPDFVIDQSMAVQLSQQGITGQPYLAVVKAGKNIGRVTPAVNFPVQYPVVQSQPGEMADITRALESLYTKIESIDIEGLVGQWKQAAEKVNGILSKNEISPIVENLKDASTDLKRLMASVSRPATLKELNRVLADLAATTAAAQKASETLAAQLKAIPPGAFEDIVKRVDEMVRRGGSQVDSAGRQTEQALTMMQQSLFRLNQVLGDLNGLVDTLRENPDRILNRPRESQPFGR